MPTPDPLIHALTSGSRTTPSQVLQGAIDHIMMIDTDFRKVNLSEPLLQVRQWPPSFAALVRIIIGQQLSAIAAQAIFSRLAKHIDLTPADLLTTDEASLKSVGLSRNKIKTCKCLAEAIITKRLLLDDLQSQPDSQVVAALTQISGIGIWTAEVFMLFSLQRLDSFPASDLAIQIAYQSLKSLVTRPTRKALIQHCEQLRPYRGAAAHLLWHYYGTAVLGG